MLKAAKQQLRLGVCVGFVLFGSGCGVRYHVTGAAVPPEQLGTFKTEAPRIPAVLQITNFTINKVDTQYSEEDKDVFRHHMSVAIPNLLQEVIGKKQAFSEVTRVATANPTVANYVVSGDYDFFERLGTGARRWIPFYGMFGGKINEAWVKGLLHIRVADARTGTEVLNRSYPEEHRERTSIYQPVYAGYLQPDYLSTIASDIINSVPTPEGRSHPEGSQRPAPPPAAVGPTSPVADRLRALDDLNHQGLISDKEYKQRRKKILDEAF